jgi:hypothetical protein
MRYQLTLLVFGLPSALASVAYTVPQKISVLVNAAECDLPDDFNVRSFIAESPDDVGAAVENLEFQFLDDSTKLSTRCQWNSTSAAIGDAGRTPRFACQNDLVQFIWQNQTLTVIEKVCPGTDG